MVPFHTKLAHLVTVPKSKHLSYLLSNLLLTQKLIPVAKMAKCQDVPYTVKSGHHKNVCKNTHLLQFNMLCIQRILAISLFDIKEVHVWSSVMDMILLKKKDFFLAFYITLVCTSSV